MTADLEGDRFGVGFGFHGRRFPLVAENQTSWEWVRVPNEGQARTERVDSGRPSFVVVERKLARLALTGESIFNTDGASNGRLNVTVREVATRQFGYLFRCGACHLLRGVRSVPDKGHWPRLPLFHSAMSAGVSS